MQDVTPPPTSGQPPVAGWRRTFTALASPNFRVLWFGTLCTTAGMQMNMVAQPWLAYHLWEPGGRGGLAVGLVAASWGVAMVLAAPIAGVVADRIHKRKVLLSALFSLTALGLCTAVLVHLGTVRVWHLVIISMAQGTVLSFQGPIRQAYIPELVRGGHMANAMAMDHMALNLNRIVAPIIAGVLLAWRTDAAFFSTTILYIIAMLILTRLPQSSPTAFKPKVTLKDIVKDFVAGARYIKSQPMLLTIIGMGFMFSMLGMPFQRLLPVFQSEVFNVGETRLGLMFTAVGIGALIGSLAVAYLADHPRKGLFQVIGGIACVLSLTLFALSTSYWISLVFLVLVGLTFFGFLTINRIQLMISTDRAYLGRALGISFMAVSLGTLALLPIGALVDILGAPKVIVGSSVLLGAFILITAVLRPSLWRGPRDSSQ